VTLVEHVEDTNDGRLFCGVRSWHLLALLIFLFIILVIGLIVACSSGNTLPVLPCIVSCVWLLGKIKISVIVYTTAISRLKIASSSWASYFVDYTFLKCSGIGRLNPSRYCTCIFHHACLSEILHSSHKIAYICFDMDLRTNSD